LNEFCTLFSIEFSAGCDDPPSIAPLANISYLCEAGKAGLFVHYLKEAKPQWDTLCQLEDALVNNKANEGFIFVIGSVASEPEIQGWLEFEDFIIIPYGPEMQKSGDQMGVWGRSDFDQLDYSVVAFCPACDESGIILNKMVKETCPERYPLGCS
jgi:hypothetical protein